MRIIGAHAESSPRTSTTTVKTASTRPSATSLRTNSNVLGLVDRKSPPVRQIGSTSLLDNRRQVTTDGLNFSFEIVRNGPILVKTSESHMDDEKPLTYDINGKIKKS